MFCVVPWTRAVPRVSDTPGVVFVQLRAITDVDGELFVLD